MSDNQFIREEIKEKPVNYRKFWMKIGRSALCGLAFALVASLGFAFLEPRFSMLFSAKEEEGEEAPVTETEDTQVELETEMTDTELQDYTLTLEDYQKIQTELYQIGTKANKSIVTVTGVSSETDWFSNSYENENQGSGVIISDSSSQILILTERKNIASAESISVTFIDDSTLDASLVSYDGNTGLAVISVDKNQMSDSTENVISTAVFGNSTMVTNGEMVIALGSPLGTNYSILVGNITSKNNMITTPDCNYSIFTTDITASKGGTGVLINTDGEIIGIVMQDYSNSQDEGTLTAVASNDLTNLISKISNGKTIPYLGVEMTTVTDKIAKNYDIPKGVYVKEVELDSPALLGGLQAGDVITKFDGISVNAASALNSQLMKCNSGDQVEIVVERQSGESYNEVTLQIELGTK